MIRHCLTRAVLVCILSVIPVSAADESYVGKLPDAPEVPPPLIPYVTSLEDLPPRPPPKPFTNLENAAQFIRHQRGLHGKGLPATFFVPKGIVVPNELRQLIISEGVGLYDTALAVIVFVEAGQLTETKEILDIYAGGQYGTAETAPLELRAFPSSDNSGAFAPFDGEVYYFFNFTNVHANWLRWREKWPFWITHSGPNAWMINALVRCADAVLNPKEKRKYIALAERLAAALLRLQDKEALGGIRYGPHDDYHEPGTSDPFYEINSENNVSAYAALKMLNRIDPHPKYEAAAQKILQWFHDAPVLTLDGKPRKGVMDPHSHMFVKGAEYKDGRWFLQQELPTDSGGTWTISSLGPEEIDALWGTGAAYGMWQGIRERAGRTAQFRFAKAGDVLAGLDFNALYPENESLISPEWSAGGLFALRALLDYYSKGKGGGQLSASQLAQMQKDAESMTAFIRKNPNPYAFGPGNGGSRQNQTGFYWYCPPAEVHAMASLYFTLYLTAKSDPLAWWRGN